ncbi:lipopolysaccharide biosynthesis protein [Lentilitoribacter sp. EG35]|uniref:lipopolysaccharide biosynthesis protein n=1 Tax=Lentilitoribacter sp. EG35 TaxID=3234192 RepID=UPI00345F3C44
MLDHIRSTYLSNFDNIRSYAILVSGSAGRLVISLIYFILVANTLSFDEFGLFAAASATGIILSRFFAFGFVSPLYRIATAKKRLLGVYTSGLIAGAILSMPIIAVVAIIIYYLMFAHQMLMITFLFIVFAEVIFWRTLEVAVILLNGLYKFGHASILVIIGTLVKMLTSALFVWLSMGDLQDWGIYYICGNAASAAIAVLFYYPKVRLRWRVSLYYARWIDSLSVAAAELTYYTQNEVDKLLVLAMGGPKIAGIYAILMRLIDLTALPVRSMLTLLIQKIMQRKSIIQSLKNRLIFEAAIGGISLAGIIAMALILSIFPNLLGDNVAEVTPILIFVALVPCFRNLAEYHSELLYGVNRTVIRTRNALLLGILKTGLLALLLHYFATSDIWLTLLNGVFGILYIASLFLSYPAIDKIAPLQKSNV